jgi:Tfp pilus assembly protein PilV
MTDVTVTFGGWGYDAWDAYVWGESNAPALPVGTGAIGSVGVTGNAVVSVSGVSGTTALGTTIAQANASVSVTGVSATGIAATLSGTLQFISAVGAEASGAKVRGVSH